MPFGTSPAISSVFDSGAIEVVCANHDERNADFTLRYWRRYRGDRVRGDDVRGALKTTLRW